MKKKTNKPRSKNHIQLLPVVPHLVLSYSFKMSSKGDKVLEEVLRRFLSLSSLPTLSDNENKFYFG